ncbi:MAG: hypothetical protein ACI97A_003052 [Planctomycetota bacterium]|jgi:hypothetical protein
MLEYDFPLYRPPSEAENLIFQVTLGCSFNRCSFCSMYRDKAYELRPLHELAAEIKLAAQIDPGARKVFLADGDALGAPTSHLLEIAKLLRDNFKDLQRITSYAWPLNVLNKSPEELKELRDAGLKLIYVGLESGDDELLRRIRKGANGKMHAETIDKARAAGMKVSATVILGLGGKKFWQQHVEGTAQLINSAPPNFLSTLQLGLASNVEAEFIGRFKGEFVAQDDDGMLLEQREILDRLNPSRPVIFRSNHASNALALAGNLPKDRERLVREVDEVRAGLAPRRPKWMRGY